VATRGCSGPTFSSATCRAFCATTTARSYFGSPLGPSQPHRLFRQLLSHLGNAKQQSSEPLLRSPQAIASLACAIRN
jgi:hypothetical protein